MLNNVSRKNREIGTNFTLFYIHTVIFVEKIFCEKPVCSSQLKRNNSFPPIKATAMGFSAIRKQIFFGKFFDKVIILKLNVRNQIIIKNTSGYRIISFFVKKKKKKSTCTKQIFINLQFPKNPLRLCEDKWPNFDAPPSSLKRFLGRRYFGFKLVTFSQLFLQGLHNRCGKPPFFERPTKYIPRYRKQCFVFHPESIFKKYFSSRS